MTMRRAVSIVSILMYIRKLNRIRAISPALQRGTKHVLTADTVRGVLDIEPRIAGEAAFVLCSTGVASVDVVIPWKGHLHAWPEEILLHREGKNMRISIPAESVYYLLPE